MLLACVCHERVEEERQGGRGNSREPSVVVWSFMSGRRVEKAWKALLILSFTLFSMYSMGVWRSSAYGNCVDGLCEDVEIHEQNLVPSFVSYSSSILAFGARVGPWKGARWRS